MALLVLHTPPYAPIDVILSYSHLCLQNSNLEHFIPRFREQAKVETIVAASPLSMGLLTGRPPSWHPAPPPLVEAVNAAKEIWDGDFIDLALGYSLRHAGVAHGNVPMVAGFSNPTEVHECVKVWREVKEGVNEERRIAGEESARQKIRESGYLDWSWSSP